MNSEEIRQYCISKNGVEESMPFGIETLVFKVGGKMYLLLALDVSPVQFNVKCKPDVAIDLREKYKYVLPGYHMNKSHWNTIIVNDEADTKLLKEWIDESYDLVFKSLSIKVRKRLAQ